MSTVQRLRAFSGTALFAAAVVVSAVELVTSEAMQRWVIEDEVESGDRYKDVKTFTRRLTVSRDDSQCTPRFDYKYELTTIREDGKEEDVVICFERIGWAKTLHIGILDASTRVRVTPLKEVVYKGYDPFCPPLENRPCEPAKPTRQL